MFRKLSAFQTEPCGACGHYRVDHAPTCDDCLYEIDHQLQTAPAAPCEGFVEGTELHTLGAH